MREKAKSSSTNPKDIIKDVCQNAPSAVLGALPRPSVLTREIQNARKTARSPTANPTSLSELVFPAQYSSCGPPENQQPFLLFDSEQESGEDRILMFSTRRNLEILSRCSTWFGDGTFKMDDLVVVLVLALLPHKDIET
jgi:hypothetical protein